MSLKTMDRNSYLYRIACKLAGESMDWDAPTTALLQYEMRHDYVANMPTLNLIATVIRDEDERTSWMMNLTEIQALEDNRVRIGYPDLDDALGQGRR